MFLGKPTIRPSLQEAHAGRVRLRKDTLCPGKDTSHVLGIRSGAVRGPVSLVLPELKKSLEAVMTTPIIHLSTMRTMGSLPSVPSADKNGMSAAVTISTILMHLKIC